MTRFESRLKRGTAQVAAVTRRTADRCDADMRGADGFLRLSGHCERANTVPLRFNVQVSGVGCAVPVRCGRHVPLTVQS